MRNKGVSASQPASQWCIGPGIIHRWAVYIMKARRQEFSTVSPHCSVLTLTEEARIQTGLSHFYRPVKLGVLDFMGFVLCMCVLVCYGEPAPYGYHWLREFGNVGSRDCIQLHLQWHDQHHQGIHWNSSREILSFQYSTVILELSNEGRYMCLIEIF